MSMFEEKVFMLFYFHCTVRVYVCPSVLEHTWLCYGHSGVHFRCSSINLGTVKLIVPEGQVPNPAFQETSLPSLLCTRKHPNQHFASSFLFQHFFFTNARLARFFVTENFEQEQNPHCSFISLISITNIET